MSSTDQVRAAVGELTGRTPSEVRPVGGGDTSAAFRARLDDGTAVFAKSAPEDMPGAIAAEAASLSWLAETGAVSVPTVHGHDDRWLVIDHIESGSPTAGKAEDLGRGLAAMHNSGAAAHGAPPPGGPTDAWIGLAPMRNVPADDWPSFYAEQRIAPYLRRAVDSGALRRDEAEVIDRVREQLPDLAGPAESPARLHGDLWSGNVHWGERAWLIDPAGHGGHRETDLAMLHLFGCPHLDRVVAAYEEASPLADGWRERIGLHQLFPLLVHAVLFGGGFAGQAVAAARSALRG